MPPDVCLGNVLHIAGGNRGKENKENGEEKNENCKRNEKILKMEEERYEKCMKMSRGRLCLSLC